MGFTQALRGFEADMVVLNAEWERKKVPDALAELMKSLLVCPLYHIVLNAHAFVLP